MTEVSTQGLGVLVSRTWDLLDPRTLKPNQYWLGPNNDHLAEPISSQIDRILGCFELREQVKHVLLYGRLAELKGLPAYRGRDPQEVKLFFCTKNFVSAEANRAQQVAKHIDPADTLGLRLKVMGHPEQIHDALDYVGKRVVLYRNEIYCPEPRITT